MKKFVKREVIRLLIWVGYKWGLWKNISNSKKCLANRDLTEEYIKLAEVCYYTDLDRDYLKVSVKNRAAASILLLIKEAGANNTMPTSKPEELKEMIEQTFNTKIEEEENGYRAEGTNMISFWRVNCPKEYKRLMELFSIVLILKGKNQ